MTTSAEVSADFMEDLTRGTVEGTPEEFGVGAMTPGCLAALPVARTTCRRQ